MLRQYYYNCYVTIEFENWEVLKRRTLNDVINQKRQWMRQLIELMAATCALPAWETAKTKEPEIKSGNGGNGGK